MTTGDYRVGYQGRRHKRGHVVGQGQRPHAKVVDRFAGLGQRLAGLHDRGVTRAERDEPDGVSALFDDRRGKRVARRLELAREPVHVSRVRVGALRVARHLVVA